MYGIVRVNFAVMYLYLPEERRLVRAGAGQMEHKESRKNKNERVKRNKEDEKAREKDNERTRKIEKRRRE